MSIFGDDCDLIVNFAAYDFDVDTMLASDRHLSLAEPCLKTGPCKAYVRSAVFSSRSERLGRDLDGRLVSWDPLLEMEEVGGVFHLTCKNIHVNCVFNIYIYIYLFPEPI